MTVGEVGGVGEVGLVLRYTGSSSKELQRQGSAVAVTLGPALLLPRLGCDRLPLISYTPCSAAGMLDIQFLEGFYSTATSLY